MNKTTLAGIQKQLDAYNFDGWLIYDFRKSNDLAHSLLGFKQDIHLTRRFYYFIPRQGEPVKIVHAIESFHFDFLRFAAQLLKRNVERFDDNCDGIFSSQR
ncbi:MAG: hypothetical protein M1391_18445 [Bacteroidetes bacterium]|nr:hypothetical protein [Bacteroidota bacterium]